MRLSRKGSVAIAATLAWAAIGWFLPPLDGGIAYAIGGALMLATIAVIEITDDEEEGA